MSNLLQHPNTKLQLDNLVDEPRQSILLIGENGMGKHSIAENLAARILKIDQAKLRDHPYFHSIIGDDRSIKIDSIREIQSFIKLKAFQSSNQSINRVILIENSSKMGEEAQNALLKMLEEPPEATMFILTVSSEQELLDTIRSRTSKILILPISKAQAIEYFSEQKFKESDILKAYAISSGKPGLISSILNNKNHPLLEDIALAKEVLTEKPESRLLRVDALAKDKQKIASLLKAFLSITHAALIHASTSNNLASVKTWHKRQELINKTSVVMSKNPNSKLLLDDLFINL